MRHIRRAHGKSNRKRLEFLAVLGVVIFTIFSSVGLLQSSSEEGEALVEGFATSANVERP